MSEEFIFTHEEPQSVKPAPTQHWKVLLIDDEPEVHTVTKLALKDFEFRGKGLDFYSAYSGAELEELIQTHPDTAVIILDVVMETDDAGLKAVKFIREVVKNSLVRIILRTGQPGQAPEKKVIVNYDINDYKSKTELTAQKLFSVIVSSIRAYEDLQRIERSRRGLERIQDISRQIYSASSIENFIPNVLEQVCSSGLFHAVHQPRHGFVATHSLSQPENWIIANGVGKYEGKSGLTLKEGLEKPQYLDCQRVFTRQSKEFIGDHFYAYCPSRVERRAMLFAIKADVVQFRSNEKLIEVLMQNVEAAFENMQLQAEIEDTQREVVFRLSEAVEQRSAETGNHVKRVALISYFLAKQYGLSEREAEILKHAAPMHDVGKIGIPDEILHFPGRLDQNQRQRMNEHPVNGYNILKGSKRRIIQAAATVSLDHHEKWDGSGYPEGKEGDAIHIYGRIVALADVYDALRHKRSYKQSWSCDQVVEEIKQQKGRHFDPHLVDVFLENVDELEQIIKLYQD